MHIIFRRYDERVINSSFVVRDVIKQTGVTKADFIELLNKYAGLCWICGLHLATQFDHVVPSSKGGDNRIENLRPICRYCNPSKGNKHPFDVEQIRQSTYSRRGYMIVSKQINHISYQDSEYQAIRICDMTNDRYEQTIVFDCFKLNIELLRFEFLYQYPLELIELTYQSDFNFGA
jgi:hypothetical protein